jgi:meso-butanediol dehydrogenase / (S,S)-butanediol dehydrogenase / diacetyl reductase
MLNDLKFNKAPVIVTGGGTGIGQSCAEVFAELGAHVIITGRTEKTLRETEALVTKAGGTCEVHVCDAAREADVLDFHKKIAAKHPFVKAMVNNAGNNHVAKITELATEKWREIMAVDLDSIFYMCKAFIPLLQKAPRSGNIVNVASTFGVIGSPNMPVYCAAKGAVISLTRQMAVDYGKANIRVNSLCPGPTLSPRVKGYFDKGLVPIEPVERLVMLGRLAECREIANVAAFLASDAASFMHGTAVVVDGGQTIN